MKENQPSDSAPQVSVVIPVFNEESTLPELIRRCLASCESLNRSFEIILVDDGSTDRSRTMIEEASAANLGRMIGVLLNRNYGQHSAVMAGLEQSRGEIVVTLDADLQNPPEEIPQLVAKLEEAFDVIGTVRKNR